MNRPNLTVAICTFNGAQRVPKVLERLKLQSTSLQIPWEILVVDNNSDDDTEEVIKKYQSTWDCGVPLHYKREYKRGLGFARQCAVQVSRAPWVGFLDDDNLPAENWIECIYNFQQEHPHAGVFGGRIKGVYEVSPPKYFERIERFWAIGGGGKKICYTSSSYPHRRKRIYPPGAGAVVNREAWLAFVPPSLTLQGRSAGKKLPGEDIEAFSYIRNGGLEIWYNPSMVVEHLIPKERLRKDYIYDLMWRTGLSRYYTRRTAYSKREYMAMAILFWFNDLRKLLIHLFRKKDQEEIVSTAEKLLILGSLVSPILTRKSEPLSLSSKWIQKDAKNEQSYS